MAAPDTGLATGYALAGGQSRRMGRDKALLSYGGATLLEHTLSRLKTVCGDVRILCGPTHRYATFGVEVETDPGIGPLGAVLRGLERSPLPACLFLAVDLPGVSPGLLSRLLSLLPGYDAVVPISEKGPEPLCAVYAAQCHEAIRTKLEAGERKMTSFYSSIRIRSVLPTELEEFGELPAIFRNLNTPDELGKV